MRSDAESLAWGQNNLPELREKASQIFRAYMEKERKLKRIGGSWVNSWRWEQAIAEILDVPVESPIVDESGKKLRKLEEPYRLENYDNSERFERLLDRLQDLVRSI